MSEMMAVSIAPGQENTGLQKSSGKRCRTTFHKDEGSANKRQALVCLSNRAELAIRREEVPNKTRLMPSSVFDLTCHLPQLDTTPGPSPMLSSPPDLSCSENFIKTDLHSTLTTCYSKEVFAYLREAEVRWQPKTGYMQKQPDITSGMRSVLVDWLVEVVDEFNLQSTTLYMAVGLVDRFLSVMSVLRGKLQLVGTTAMYIAAKLEEIYPPELVDFAYITDNTYSQTQIVQMERLVLQTLDYHLIAPTSLCFLHHYLQTVSPSPTSSSVLHLAQYLCEMALVNSDPFLKYLPSEVASSSVCLARHTLDQQPAWPMSLRTVSGYSVSDVCHCLQDMHRMFAMAPQHSQQAVRLKYSSDRFSRVALLTVPETLPM